MKACMTLLALILYSGMALSATSQKPRVELRTNRGAMIVELYPEQAPQSVDAFLHSVQDGFYDGTLFHRVLKGLLIEGGGYGPGMQEKPPRTPIPNESSHCVPNLRGTIALAHAADADLSSSQFFINLADNHGLDFHATVSAAVGYCAFGRVVRGMQTVLAIAQTPVMSGGDFVGDVPLEEIIIESARVMPANARSGDDDGEAAHEFGDDNIGP
jgi:peptidyl-prolyl cis-trans isomerase A (cyclophilin A)/peptidyl-prolyl cis-trans isomerase B (cyclophilin B)